MMKKALPYIVVALVVMVISLFIPRGSPEISVRAEPLFNLGPIVVTNSILTAWISTLLIIIFCFLATRAMQMRPGALQNVLEMAVEGIYNLTESVAGPEWVKRFFAIPATIFIFVLISNFFGLLIGLPLAGVGVCEAHHAAEAAEGEDHAEAAEGETQAEEEGEVHAEAAAEDEEESGGTSTCAPGEILVPLFRAPAADLNFTLSLAVITQVAAWTFGIIALGVGGFLGKFFIVDGITKAKNWGERTLGIINFLVGLIELMSEFVKIIAFTFRLFGNIFAGEVMLVVIMFLVPLLVVTPLIGFEIFVNFVQAFIFYILSVAFYTVAIQGHGSHDESHH